MIPLILHSSPWSAFAGIEGMRLEPGEAATFSPTGSIRAESPEREEIVWDGKRLPLVAPGFKGATLRLFDIPLTSVADPAHHYDVDGPGGAISVRLEGVPIRAADVDRPTDPREQWLGWQVQRYLELGHLADESDVSAIEARAGAGAMRRSWESVGRLWKDAGGSEPVLSLVVQLARDKSLEEALRLIVKSPRKQLVRVREPQRIDRIQELDAACLRAYSRAPGRTAVEKAGAYQRLVAVVRREDVDLLENRIAHWVLISIEKLADVFLAQNKDMPQSSRFREVAQFRALVRRWLQAPLFNDVSSLGQHPTAPTYCLQSEKRYKKVWEAYQAIRHDKRIVDDAWRWQLRQWGSTSRVLLSCLLRGLPGWREERVSTPYFREQGIEGTWLVGPSVPGPFHSDHGMCHLLDSRDSSAPEMMKSLELPAGVEETGCDWLLVWPESKRLLVVWASIHFGGDGAAGVSAVDKKLSQLSGESDWSWNGLMFIAEPETSGENVRWIDVFERTFVLRAPAEIHRWWKDLEAGFDLVVEAAASHAG